MPSSDPRIEADFKRFFAHLPAGGTLVLTTFAFDEMVLAQLLKEMRVQSKYRIFVFHDILGHRNPGYLRRFYTQAQTVAVCLRPKARVSCPVFHTKMWMVLQAPRRIVRLAVHSINLTRYHLRNSAPTWESFWVRTNLKMRLPISPLLDLIGGKVTRRRVAPPPETFVVDEDKAGKVTFSRTTQSAGDVVRARCKAGGLGELIAAAAPFVLEKVVNALANGASSPRMYTGVSEKMRALHAKFLVFKGGLVAGSANLTNQAMRFGKAPVNHETILNLNRTPEGLLGQLKQFRNPANECEVPGDDDGMGTTAKKWADERRLAECGPHRVSLVLKRHPLSVSLRLDRPLAGVRRIILKSAGDTTATSPPDLLLRAAHRIDLPGKKQHALAEILFRPPVIVEGLLFHGTNPVWRREMDLDDFWEVIKECAGGTASVGLPGMGTGRPSERNGPKTHSVSSFDVREMRDRVLDPKATPIRDAWLTWILRYHPDAREFREMPPWVLDLRKQLRRRRGHA